MNETIKGNNENNQKKEQDDHDYQKPFSYLCPHCQQQTITVEKEIVEDIVLTCPNCGKKGILRPLQKKQNNAHKDELQEISKHVASIKKRKNISLPALEAKLLGVILIILGIVLHFVVNLISIKITYVFIIIGVIIFTFIPSTRKISLNSYSTNTTEKLSNESNTHHSSLRSFFKTSLIKQFDISEKIAVVLILWIIFIYFLTGVNDVDLFFIFVYLGVLLVKVFSNELTPVHLRRKMNIFTVAFLFIFLLIVIRRILLIANL